MQRVAKWADVPAGHGLQVEVGGEAVVLVRDGDAVRAYAGKCPHAGANLAEGAVCAGRIICPWHKAMFAVTDGALLEPPALHRLTRYDAAIEGEHVLVGAAMVEAPLPAAHAEPVAVVVGAGAAGAAGAAALREFGFAGRIVLIGREPGPPYDRTALSKFVPSGEMPAADVPPVLSPDALAELRIERIEQTVTHFDAAAARLTLQGGAEMAFDMALLAPGAAPKAPDIPGAGLDAVCRLRDRADAAAIARHAGPAHHAVIQGGSFIGLEVASALRKAGTAVTVVMREPVPFAKQMGARLGAAFKALHDANGVVFRIRRTIARIEGARIEGAARVERVVLDDGSALAADLVVVGIGVRPDTGFIAGLDLAEDGGIAVDAAMRAGPRVWAAGDAARFPFGGQKQVKIEHWRVAQHTARIAARAMAGAGPAPDGVPFFWTYHFGKRFEYLGHPARWDEEVIDGDLDAQKFVALLGAAGMVVGVVACDRERATAVLIERMRTGLTMADAHGVLATGAAE